ncbi:mitotic cohesin complex, non-SMC subunit Rad21 (kleisin) [Tyrophagus putrescentiae]|nr:mitotic cohesin complex, non-SMC subunit Rad21 (kleisin) [Tyrophagus putrescentiae]
MFYSVFVLGKKGPLARVWLAAHWDKKITKAQILETNIVESVDSILQPKVKLSLRTSSHLLLGIVRIYARKTLYLLQDCQDAAFKIKSAFRPGVVDLPDGKTEAAISAITLPEMFDFINDFDIHAEPQILVEPTTSANLRNITLPDDISSINVDDQLMDGHPWSDIGSIGGGSINISNGNDLTLNDSGISNNVDMFDRPALDDGFGGQLGVGIVDEDDVFGMTMPSQEEVNAAGSGAAGEGTSSQANLENGHGGEESNLDNPISSRPNSPAMSDNMSFGDGASIGGSIGSPGSADMLDDIEPFDAAINHNGHHNMDNDSMITDDSHIHRAGDSMAGGENGQPSHNTLVLEPIDSQLGGLLERKRKRRKKIGMVIDEVKTLSGEEMKSQLSDTKDIVTNLDLAPPNKMLMNWKKTGLSDKLFTLPERNISTKVLVICYSRNLITSRYDGTAENEILNEDWEAQEEAEDLINLNGYPQSAGPHHPDQANDIDAIIPNSPEMAAPKTPEGAQVAGTAAEEAQDGGEGRQGEQVRQSVGEEANNLSNLQNNHTFDGNFDSFHGGQDAPSYQQQQHQDPSAFSRESSVYGGRDHQSAHQDSLANSSAQPAAFVESDEEEKEEDPDEYFDDDFGMGGPLSVGPNEEMLPEETADQFEERIRNKRSNILLKHMGSQLEEVGHIYFSNLIRNNKRKLVAQKFYALLVLKKQMAIELEQDPENPYSELTVTKGAKYDEHMVSSA